MKAFVVALAFVPPFGLVAGLKPARYPFVGEFHETMARGMVIAE
jgi:hypothetical protein